MDILTSVLISVLFIIILFLGYVIGRYVSWTTATDIIIKHFENKLNDFINDPNILYRRGYFDSLEQVFDKIHDGLYFGSKDILRRK